MPIVIFVTAKNSREANAISRALLKKKLVACANIVSCVESFFWWRGKVDRAKETLLIFKTKKKLFKQVVQVVKKIHSYDIPEIIALPVVAGEKKYCQWIDRSTR